LACELITQRHARQGAGLSGRTLRALMVYDRDTFRRLLFQMRHFLIVLTIALLPLHVPVEAQDLGLRHLGEYVESLRVQAGIPGLAATIVGPDEIIWEQAFGWQDVDRAVATRMDTPFHLDGLTQVFTAALVLRCVEEGRLSLDDRIGQFKPDSPDAAATIRQLLTHTFDGPVFAYRPERLEPLARAIRACTDDSFRETLANLLQRLAMIDSVPGPDIVHPELLTEGIPSPSALDRYRRVLERLAVPYAVDRAGRPVASQYSETTLTTASGLISTARDLAWFDLALKKGVLLRPDTIAAARRPPAGPKGLPLPHGLGWFVQTYKGETIVWQFGATTNTSSSLVVSLPARGVTMILLANSDGLAKPFVRTVGDATVSPFVRLLLGLAVR
jgi:CubicO group peptidase (beta-lactamase class C family)